MQSSHVVWFTEAAKIYLDTLNIYPAFFYLPNIESTSQNSMPSSLGMHRYALECCAGSRIVKSCSNPVASQVPPSWDKLSFLFPPHLLFTVIHLSPSAPSGPPGVPAAQPHSRTFFCFPPKPSTKDLCSHTTIWSTAKILLSLNCESFMKHCPGKRMVEPSLL